MIDDSWKTASRISRAVPSLIDSLASDSINHYDGFRITIIQMLLPISL